MKYNHQLFLYLKSFKISALDQFNAFKAKCALCCYKLDCVTVTFEHIQTGYTTTLNLCDGCRNAVNEMYTKTLAMEDIHAQSTNDPENH